MAEQVQNGLDIGDEKPTAPARLNILRQNEVEAEIEITITEGRYHQVKRMFQAVGLKVVYLKRLSMGSLVLDENLKLGEYRELSDNELKNLKESTNTVG
jgi:16S rRNA pseudouridine516 synthase